MGTYVRLFARRENLPMFGVGTTELMIVFLIVLLLFGGAKLPQLARSLGSAISEFKTTVNRKEDDNSSDSGKTA